jgi:hypothetical protein
MAADGRVAVAASASVPRDDWSAAGGGVVRIVEETARGGAISTHGSEAVADAS